MTDAFEAWMDSDDFDPSDLTDEQERAFEEITQERQEAIEFYIEAGVIPKQPKPRDLKGKVAQLLEQTGVPMTIKQASDILGKDYDKVRREFDRLRSDGVIERVKRGVYRVKED